MGDLNEKVLVLPSRILRDNGYSRPCELVRRDRLFSSLRLYWDMINGTTAAQYSFLPRASCEGDPSYKQIIPYCVVVRHSPNPDYGEAVEDVLTYRRSKTGDGRLASKLSVGFGGHINPLDCPSFNMKKDFWESVRRNVDRELKEELGLDLAGDKIYRVCPHGYINDDSNDVGKVHFGVICKIQIYGDIELSPSEEVSSLDWTPKSGLANLLDDPTLESWSRLVVSEMVSKEAGYVQE